MPTDESGTAVIGSSNAVTPQPRSLFPASLAPAALITGSMSRLLERLRVGALQVTWPDGREREYRGAMDGPVACVEIKRSSRAAAALLLRGDLGFAQSYVNGDWDTPDLRALLELAALNEQALMHNTGGVFGYAFNLFERVSHALKRNSRTGSRRNIAFHYDLGNDFYAKWLDASMTYSSALFGDSSAQGCSYGRLADSSSSEYEASTLEDAQAAKYARLLSLIEPGRDDHVLEMGCGWGGFAIEAVQRTGCRVTGITLSQAQADYATARVREAGLSERIDIRLVDYRDLSGCFDHIMSIEMFEAVGERYWPGYFDTVHRCLKPGGRAAFQVITIADDAFASYRQRPDFIQRHVFPGGMLPSPRRFDEQARRAGLERTAWDFFGADYARTLVEWHERFVAAREDVLSLPGFDARFERLWRYYLAYCEAGFRIGRVDLMQALYTRPA